MADFIGGGLPTVPPSAADSDPDTSDKSPAPVSTLDPPASNPGSDDPSGGIAKDAGGTSNTAYIQSPQQHEEKKTVVGSVLESVFGKRERSADEVDSSTPATTSNTDNNATVASNTGGDQATGAGAPGVLGAVAGAAAAGTAAVASYVGLSNTDATPKEEGDKTAAAVEKNTAETLDATGEKANKDVDDPKDGVHDASHVGSQVGNHPKQVTDHEAANRENADAIPTAGGEKLGTAHEGESKVVPDVPPENPSADETKPGQPDKATADNTAKNVGDATAPATTTTTAAAAAASSTPATPASGQGHKRVESSSGKPKFFDRLKAKLHLDKKDKA